MGLFNEVVKVILIILLLIIVMLCWGLLLVEFVLFFYKLFIKSDY